MHTYAGMYLFACTQADMLTVQAMARNARGLTTVLAVMIMKIQGQTKHHVVAQTASKQLTLQLVLAYGVLPLAEAAVAVQSMGMVFTGTIYSGWSS